jgi:hypothetical protein
MRGGEKGWPIKTQHAEKPPSSACCFRFVIASWQDKYAGGDCSGFE